jgi:hypothetical protein
MVTPLGRCVSAGFIDFSVARDLEISALAAAFRSNRGTAAKSLRRAPDEPDETCCPAREGWWLSTAEIRADRHQPCYSGGRSDRQLSHCYHYGDHRRRWRVRLNALPRIRISSPQRTAFSALPNSTSMPSPMLRTDRPLYFKIIGSISSRACRAIRSCVASSSRLIKRLIANDIGQQYCRKPARDRGTRPYHSRFRYLESPLRHGRSLQISADSE